MFKNFFKVAYRNFRKNKGFSFINITGLAIGMACAILILLWIQNEVSYDQFHEKKARIFRMQQDRYENPSQGALAHGGRDLGVTGGFQSTIANRDARPGRVDHPRAMRGL